MMFFGNQQPKQQPKQVDLKTLSADQLNQLDLEAEVNEDLSEFLPNVILTVDEGREAWTLLEKNIVKIENLIRGKDRWVEKFEDEVIQQKWKKELLLSDVFTEEMVKFAFELLKDEISVYYDREGIILPGMVPGTFIADDYIPKQLRQDLIDLASLMEQKFPRDYHPGSDDKVLDLVHPSLFPLIIGVSRKVNINHPWQLTIGSGSAISHYTRSERQHFESEKYSWLPTNFRVEADGLVKFKGYINNINPVSYPDAYVTIPKILEKFIPLWEKVLTRMTAPRENCISVDDDWYEGVERWPDFEEENIDEETWVPPPPNHSKLPEKYKGQPRPKVKVNLKGRDLQVVVKLANIELDPKDAHYPGGAWHVEGMRNENIIATGLYYYVVDNITESRLQFREAVEDPGYEQGDESGVMAIYGLSDGDKMNRNLGYVVAKEGRCLAFPNTLQHCVQPFDISDKVHPANRKILAFFLINPCTKIPSTSEIPPQQMDWYKYALRKVVSTPNKRSFIPEFAVNLICDYLDFPISWEKAKEHRDILMSERTAIQKDTTEDTYEREFSLCEH
eukprot:Filipodium_phascolosomae@DN273_c0_g1_i1.p1